MQSDIEIARSSKMLPIREIAEGINIKEEELEYYGHYKAKLPLSLLNERRNTPDGKLILVTAMNPTPAGEGKTTMSCI